MSQVALVSPHERLISGGYPIVTEVWKYLSYNISNMRYLVSDSGIKYIFRGVLQCGMIILPIFEYQCFHCGLQFEKLWKTQATAKKAGDTYSCKACGKPAQKQISTTNFGFNQAVTGPVPQSTGIHSIDSKFDQVIGRDAAAKWKLINERQVVKKQILSNNPGSEGADLRRTSSNEYVVMPSQDRGMSERARSLHSEALKRIDAAKQNSSSG